MRRSNSAAICAMLLTGCAGARVDAAPIQENAAVTIPPPPSASRPAPAAVAPVTLDGVRYQQMPHAPAGSGVLEAVDDRSGERLWTLKVYGYDLVPGLETDVQEVYFRSLATTGTHMLTVVNERGDTYHVDVQARTATKAE